MNCNARRISSVLSLCSCPHKTKASFPLSHSRILFLPPQRPRCPREIARIQQYRIVQSLAMPERCGNRLSDSSFGSWFMGSKPREASHSEQLGCERNPRGTGWHRDQANGTWPNNPKPFRVRTPDALRGQVGFQEKALGAERVRCG